MCESGWFHEESLTDTPLTLPEQIVEVAQQIPGNSCEKEGVESLETVFEVIDNLPALTGLSAHQIYSAIHSEGAELLAEKQQIAEVLDLMKEQGSQLENELFDLLNQANGCDDFFRRLKDFLDYSREKILTADYLSDKAITLINFRTQSKINERLLEKGEIGKYLAAKDRPYLENFDTLLDNLPLRDEQKAILHDRAEKEWKLRGLGEKEKKIIADKIAEISEKFGDSSEKNIQILAALLYGALPKNVSLSRALSFAKRKKPSTFSASRSRKRASESANNAGTKERTESSTSRIDNLAKALRSLVGGKPRAALDLLATSSIEMGFTFEAAMNSAIKAALPSQKNHYDQLALTVVRDKNGEIVATKDICDMVMGNRIIEYKSGKSNPRKVVEQCVNQLKAADKLAEKNQAPFNTPSLFDRLNAVDWDNSDIVRFLSVISEPTTPKKPNLWIVVNEKAASKSSTDPETLFHRQIEEELAKQTEYKDRIDVISAEKLMETLVDHLKNRVDVEAKYDEVLRTKRKGERTRIMKAYYHYLFREDKSENAPSFNTWKKNSLDILYRNRLVQEASRENLEKLASVPKHLVRMYEVFLGSLLEDMDFRNIRAGFLRIYGQIFDQWAHLFELIEHIHREGYSYKDLAQLGISDIAVDICNTTNNSLSGSIDQNEMEEKLQQILSKLVNLCELMSEHFGLEMDIETVSRNQCRIIDGDKTQVVERKFGTKKSRTSGELVKMLESFKAGETTDTRLAEKYPHVARILEAISEDNREELAGCIEYLSINSEVDKMPNPYLLKSFLSQLEELDIRGNLMTEIEESCDRNQRLIDYMSFNMLAFAFIESQFKWSMWGKVNLNNVSEHLEATESIVIPAMRELTEINQQIDKNSANRAVELAKSAIRRIYQQTYSAAKTADYQLHERLLAMQSYDSADYISPEQRAQSRRLIKQVFYQNSLILERVFVMKLERMLREFDILNRISEDSAIEALNWHIGNLANLDPNQEVNSPKYLALLGSLEAETDYKKAVEDAGIQQTKNDSENLDREVSDLDETKSAIIKILKAIIDGDDEIEEMQNYKELANGLKYSCAVMDSTRSEKLEFRDSEAYRQSLLKLTFLFEEQDDDVLKMKDVELAEEIGEYDEVSKLKRELLDICGVKKDDRISTLIITAGTAGFYQNLAEAFEFAGLKNAEYLREIILETVKYWFENLDWDNSSIVQGVFDHIEEESDKKLREEQEKREKLAKENSVKARLRAKHVRAQVESARRTKAVIDATRRAQKAGRG